MSTTISWEQMMSEFDSMGDFDQLRAVGKEQMAWLTETAGRVPLQEALDLGFGCGFSAVAMARGGCRVTSINNEAPTVQRRIEAEQRYERMSGQAPTIITASTDSGLPRLRDEGRKFGLIFVDAGHRVDDVFIDVHYARDLCVPGGILALDDTWHGAIRVVANWIISNLGHIWTPFQFLHNTISWKRSSIEGDDAGLGLAHRTHNGPPIRFEVPTENGDEFLLYPGPNDAARLGFEAWKLGGSAVPSGDKPRN
jgi:predicted O-methyltransferase YrrM